MYEDKEIRADAKLLNLSEEELEILWRFRYPEEGGEKLTFEAIAVEIPLRYGFTASISTISDFYKKLRMRKLIARAHEIAAQARVELAKDPGFLPEHIERAAQAAFTGAAMDDGNVKAFIQLAKLRLASEKQAFEREKLAAATKSKIEAGLDALFEEIKGNARALKLFEQLKETVSKA